MEIHCAELAVIATAMARYLAGRDLLPTASRLRRRGRAPDTQMTEDSGRADDEKTPIATPGRRGQPAEMTKLCIFVGTTVGGYAGWALGEALGFGFGGAFLLSGVVSLAGVYAGWKIARRFTQ